MPHAAARRAHAAAAAAVCLCLALIAGAKDVPCTVTQGAGWTRYSVPEFNASSCHDSWANGSSHVVANHEEESRPLVLTQNSITLTTNKCAELVLYKRDCISEGISCRATCTTNCSANAGGRQDERGVRLHVCVAVFAALAFARLLLGLRLAIRYGGGRCFNAGAEVEAQRG